MYDKWIAAQWSELAMVLLSVIVVYTAILAHTRIVGLRSFSKMSSADFAMTVAIGSLFGSTISSPSPTLFVGLFALAVLFSGKWLFATLRQRVPAFSRVVENEPLLLMAGSEFVEANLLKAKVTRADVYGKLRASNTLTYEQVLAVVFETTGDISVLHSSNPQARVHPDFLKDVIGHDRLAAAATTVESKTTASQS